MTEGWFNEHYLILFSDEEIEEASKKYGIAHSLPGFKVIGLRGWDDFLVCDAMGNTYSVPTVPVDQQHLKEATVPENSSLETDSRLQQKIEWYPKPLIFGGDANESANITWVSHEQHAGLVVWWNNQYRALKMQQSKDAMRR